MKNFSRTGFSLFLLTFLMGEKKSNRLKPALLNPRRDRRESFRGLGGAR